MKELNEFLNEAQKYHISGTLKKDLEINGKGAMNPYAKTQKVLVKKGDFVNVSRVSSNNRLMGITSPLFTFYDENGKKLGIIFTSTDDIEKLIKK